MARTSDSAEGHVSSDLLAHLPYASPSPIIPPSRAASRSVSPERGLGLRTPVTVTSSFEDRWEQAREALERQKEKSSKAAQSPTNGTPGRTDAGRSGAGLTRVGSLGQKVDVKGVNGRRLRGVGPGVT